MREMYKILPFLIQIILWGSAADDGRKKVPVVIRVFLAFVLALVYLGLSALLFWVGFADQQPILVILGAVCLISILVIILLEIKTKKMN